MSIQDAVARLRRNGFAVAPVPCPVKGIGGLHAVRFTANGYVDSVVIELQAAVAIRVLNEFDPDEPLREIDPVWSHLGDMNIVVDKMLAQPTLTLWSSIPGRRLVAHPLCAPTQ
ncbi:hypothetical protein JOD54_001966 [Actinokineospora baliensis]|uniref:hypothetical protein n=1 Tax=Actinokineospora baliensis TaxID=547056 RepID=UPI0019569CEC|nr:hypothetical protein [Actinokineospora baliensis]MBM7771762.1 hypothetical protein [Actinokineospora baliensis]